MTTTQNLIPSLPQPTSFDVESPRERAFRVQAEYLADLDWTWWSSYKASQRNAPVLAPKSADEFAPVADLVHGTGTVEVIELPDTPHAPVEKMDDADVAAWLSGLGRRVTVDDIDEGVLPGITAAATRYALANRHSSFEFLADMAAKATKRTLTAGQVKGVLNCWLSQIEREARTAAKAGARVELAEGMYYVGEQVWKVQAGHHNGGHPYAKILHVHDDHGEFEFVSGGMRTIAEALANGTGRKMELAEAQEFGRLYGWCCVCGTILENEKSIANGIGPVCAKKF